MSDKVLFTNFDLDINEIFNGEKIMGYARASSTGQNLDRHLVEFAVFVRP